MGVIKVNLSERFDSLPGNDSNDIRRVYIDGENNVYSEKPEGKDFPYMWGIIGLGKEDVLVFEES